MPNRSPAVFLVLPLVLVACASGGSSASASSPPTQIAQKAGCVPNAKPAATPTPAGPSPAPANGLSVPSPFTIRVIASVPAARELAFAPNGDLFVGTGSGSIYIVRNAEQQAATPQVFANVNDMPVAGVALSLQSCALYAGAQHGVYRIPYTIGDDAAQHSPVKIASVRNGSPPPGSDGDVHHTTSLAIAGGTLYASVGSSCNSCTEIDPTRATIQQMNLDGSAMKTRATRIRNGIALAVDPQTDVLWAGDAGQDDLPSLHPYEFFDPVTLHPGVTDYGWPQCEENHNPFGSGANCSTTVAPRVEFPAYSTIIGAVFYPRSISGRFAFPAQYRGGAFVAMHGSWHQPSGCHVPPRVAFVPMNGDTPQTPVDWNDPTKQWSDFITGFQPSCSQRIGRPTGIAVGPAGDLFVADDQTGNIYRIRP